MYAFALYLLLQAQPIPPIVFDPGPKEACRVFHYCPKRH